jgi:hypothetical protein
MSDTAREELDVEAIRVRIAEMNDFELMRSARAAAILLEAVPTPGRRVQLAEARAEWRHRHAKRL